MNYTETQRLRIRSMLDGAAVALNYDPSQEAALFSLTDTVLTASYSWLGAVRFAKNVIIAMRDCDPGHLRALAEHVKATSATPKWHCRALNV